MLLSHFNLQILLFLSLYLLFDLRLLLFYLLHLLELLSLILNQRILSRLLMKSVLHLLKASFKLLLVQIPNIFHRGHYLSLLILRLFLDFIPSLHLLNLLLGPCLLYLQKLNPVLYVFKLWFLQSPQLFAHIQRLQRWIIAVFQHCNIQFLFVRVVSRQTIFWLRFSLITTNGLERLSEWILLFFYCLSAHIDQVLHRFYCHALIYLRQVSGWFQLLRFSHVLWLTI